MHLHITLLIYYDLTMSGSKLSISCFTCKVTLLFYLMQSFMKTKYFPKIEIIVIFFKNCLFIAPFYLFKSLALAVSFLMILILIKYLFSFGIKIKVNSG